MTGSPARPPKPRGEGPRRVVGGHRLRRPDEVGPWRWPGEGWLDALRAVDSVEQDAGLGYARAGQISTLSVRPGVVEASVQGHRPRPHAATIEWSTLDAAVVEGLVADLSADSAASAAVLLGDLPRPIEDHLHRRGGILRPGSGVVWNARCSCGRGGVCRHLVALAWVLAERTSEDPWLLLRLRGVDREDLQDRVRLGRRSIESVEEAPSTLVPGSPLATSIEEFWRPSAAIQDLEAGSASRHAPLALLRRLGPSPISGKFPLVGLLASAYESVAKGAAIGTDARDEDADREPPTVTPTASAEPRSIGKATAKRRRPADAPARP